MSEAGRVYLEGVAGDGSIARRNRDDWDRWSIVPRVLRQVGPADARSEVLGILSSAPVWVAPVAAQGLGHPEAEVAVARAARAAGLPIVLSQAASRDAEDVAAAAGVYLQQIYLPEHRPAIEPFLDRVVAAGAAGVVLTVDQPASPHVHPFRLAAAAARPLVSPRRPPLPEGTPPAGALHVADIAWLAARTGLPVLVKGVLHPDDARAAVEAGAAGVVVSNHGGRQIGGSITSARALPAVAAAVAARAAVLTDSGIDDADDVFRAVALGADAVLIGRPVVRALWDGGEDAAAALLAELRDEFAHSLQLAGYEDVAALRRAGRGALRALDGPEQKEER
ncbi:MAG: alpha-hydroxy acid oxidase [Microbacterium sp.]|uniref:alpha-hydroxy acid oxidase n=1 Tax=Microbacterium sp. TaxID=51671 RepID=UPI0039E4E46D